MMIENATEKPCCLKEARKVPAKKIHAKKLTKRMGGLGFEPKNH